MGFGEADWKAFPWRDNWKTSVPSSLCILEEDKQQSELLCQENLLGYVPSYQVIKTVQWKGYFWVYVAC